MQYKSRVRLRVKQDGKRVSVHIDCLILIPVFQYGSDFENEFSGVDGIAETRISPVYLFRNSKQAVRGTSVGKNEKSEETSSLFQLSYLDSNQE